MRSALLATLIAALIGGGAASAGILFIDGTSLLRQKLNILGAQYEWLRFLLPFIAGLTCIVLVRALKDARFTGLSDLILTVERDIHFPLKHHLLSILASFFALIGGLSVGQYGPIAHLGGCFALFRFPFKLDVLPARLGIACGIAAAIAAAFNAPITGLVFAHEVVLRHYSIRAFTPIAISAVVGYSVSIEIFHRPQFLTIENMEILQPTSIIIFILMGLLFGMAAVYYVRGIFQVARLTQSIPLRWRLPLSGALTGILALFIPLVGDSKPLMEMSIDGFLLETVLVLLLIKIIATLNNLGSGFAGGIVSPTMAIGGLLSCLLFSILHDNLGIFPDSLPLSAVVLCGMMTLTAPVIGAPLTGILFVMELSGSYPVAISAAVSIAVAVQTMARFNCLSYYDQQMLKQGHDMRMRRDEWQLQIETLEKWIRPAPVVVTTDTSCEKIIHLAQLKNAASIFVVDKKQCFIGSIRLPTLIKLLNEDSNLENASLDSFCLHVSDSVSHAIERSQNFIGDGIPVIDAQNHLVGTITEGDLLCAYQTHTNSYRREQTEI